MNGFKIGDFGCENATNGGKWAPTADLTEGAKIYLWVCSIQKYICFWWRTS